MSTPGVFSAACGLTMACIVMTLCSAGSVSVRWRSAAGFDESLPNVFAVETKTRKARVAIPLQHRKLPHLPALHRCPGICRSR